jgi:putative phosphonate metabolism protein
MMPPRTARIAVYYAPEPDQALWIEGCRWLGRDPGTGEEVPQPSVPGIAQVTRAPRRYGLHATLRAPFRLAAAASWADCVACARRLASALRPFDLPALTVGSIDGYIALLAAAPSTPLQDLADRTVTAFDELRAPPDAAECARRRAAGLTPRQERNLLRWGYPAVLADWVFHMTLTEELVQPDLDRFQAAASTHFAAALGKPMRVASLCLFVQATSDAPFLLAERCRFRM